MSCARQDDLHRFPWPGMSPTERAALEHHSSTCHVCQRTIGRLEGARQLLREDALVVHPSQNIRSWEKIEQKTRRANATSSAWTWAGALAMSAVAAFLWMPKDTPPQRTAATLPANQTIEVAERRTFRDERVTLHADDVTTVAFGPTGPLRHIEVIRGRVAFDVDPLTAPESLVVRTPAATIEVIGTVFTVEVQAHTRVDVARGRVRVRPHDGDTFDLVSGQAYDSTPPEPAKPVAVVENSPRPPRSKPSATKRNQADLKRARSLVRHDADAARRIAGEVLDRNARGADEVDALAVIADAFRRSGQAREAADYYGRVADHPSGAGYAEEALLWRARVLMDADDPRAALGAVESASGRFAHGVLEPERTALAVTAWLRLGEVERARQQLENANAQSLAVQTATLEVARALAETDPERALRLLESSPLPSLKTEAKALEKIIRQK